MKKHNKRPSIERWICNGQKITRGPQMDHIVCPLACKNELRICITIRIFATKGVC